MKMSSDNPFKNFSITGKTQKDAVDWFSGVVNDNIDEPPPENNANQVKKSLGGNTNEIGIGNLYFSVYDAKHKATLAIWDETPLFFIIKAMPNMFQVLNVHYMPMEIRIQVMGLLTEYTNNKTINDKTRLRMSWGLLNSISQLSPLKDCIKNHLIDHYRSPLIKIDPENWVKAASLPLQRWVYQTKK